MSTTAVKAGRGVRRDLAAGPLQDMIDSYELHLLAERKSAKTVRTYTEAAQWIAGALLLAAGLTLDASPPDIDLRAREALVTGKGGKQRRVRFSYDTARAIDRYLRERTRHAQARSPRLWLGIRNRGPMTPSGIYQMTERRGLQARVVVHPHKFRHHFSHTWLDRGGAEGDLMELNGWTSPQMLRRYGRSAASARARRSYDRIMDAS